MKDIIEQNKIIIKVFLIICVVTGASAAVFAENNNIIETAMSYPSVEMSVNPVNAIVAAVVMAIIGLAIFCIRNKYLFLSFLNFFEKL